MNQFGPQENTEIVQADTPQELIRLGCVLLRILIAVCQHQVTLAIARRLSLLSAAAFIPDSGSGNTAAAAFWLNMSEPGARALMKRRSIPVKKPGDERVYRFSDITGEF